jgi:hypothetical protein
VSPQRPSQPITPISSAPPMPAGPPPTNAPSPIPSYGSQAKPYESPKPAFAASDVNDEFVRSPHLLEAKDELEQQKWRELDVYKEDIERVTAERVRPPSNLSPAAGKVVDATNMIRENKLGRFLINAAKFTAIVACFTPAAGIVVPLIAAYSVAKVGIGVSKFNQNLKDRSHKRERANLEQRRKHALAEYQKNDLDGFRRYTAAKQADRSQTPQQQQQPDRGDISRMNRETIQDIPNAALEQMEQRVASVEAKYEKLVQFVSRGGATPPSHRPDTPTIKLGRAASHQHHTPAPMPRPQTVDPRTQTHDQATAALRKAEMNKDTAATLINAAYRGAEQSGDAQLAERIKKSLVSPQGKPIDPVTALNNLAAGDVSGKQMKAAIAFSHGIDKTAVHNNVASDQEKERFKKVDESLTYVQRNGGSGKSFTSDVASVVSDARTGANDIVARSMATSQEISMSSFEKQIRNSPQAPREISL